MNEFSTVIWTIQYLTIISQTLWQGNIIWLVENIAFTKTDRSYIPDNILWHLEQYHFFQFLSINECGLRIKKPICFSYLLNHTATFVTLDSSYWIVDISVIIITAGLDDSATLLLFDIKLCVLTWHYPGASKGIERFWASNKLSLYDRVV